MLLACLLLLFQGHGGGDESDDKDEDYEDKKLSNLKEQIVQMKQQAKLEEKLKKMNL